MEWELFLKITDELVSEKKSPMFMFALHNEPLLDKRIFDWVKHVKSKNPKCYCIVPTNAESLDIFTLTEIRESGVDQININLGAHSKEIYERTHAGLDYDRVINNINRFLPDEAMKQKLQIMFVLNRENAHESQQALRYWKQLGVHVKMIALNNRAGSLDTYDSLSLKNSHYTGSPIFRGWKNLMSSTRRSIGCELPFYQMNILFNGDVIICSCDWKRATVIGNVKTGSLRSIWNSERINEIRRLILQKRYNQISSCKECSQVK
jgi:radical SAM protein with 4Fe4S-binding SPASM domain